VRLVWTEAPLILTPAEHDTEDFAVAWVELWVELAVARARTVT
jgi:hypothetical protein